MNTGSGPVDCINEYDKYSDAQVKATCHVCLSTGSVVGLSFHAQMGLISLVSLLLLVAHITRKYLRKKNKLPNGSWIFRGNVDILMLNLIFADIFMSFGAISEIYWAHKRQVFCGSFCNAQGVLQTMGETAAALSTLSVAAYTLITVKMNTFRNYKPRICIAAVALIWTWVLLWAVIPLAMHKGAMPDADGNVQNFYTPTPWWCWINGQYMTERIIAEYLWLWVAGIGSIGLYVPCYFIVRQQSRSVNEVQPDNQNNHINENKEAGKLLLYPLAYTFCVLPLSIIRWAGFVHPDLLRSSRIVPPSMVFSSIFNLMGVINVGLIVWTRPAILLIGDDDEDQRGTSSDQLDHVSDLRRTSSHTGNREASENNVQESKLQPSNGFSGANVTLDRPM